MDYLGYFGLATEPFSHAPAPKLYFGSRQHSAALQRLTHTVGASKGLALLIGDIGHGKTTLARRLLDALPVREYEAAMLVIVHGGVTPSWLLKRIASQLGVATPADHKLDILAQLFERLREIHAQGRRAVVLIDEAQMLGTREIMEEFRGLLNIEVPGQKLISFVFFGLPELETQLGLDPPLAQRVAMRYRLQALDAADTAAYVQHRLRAAGALEAIFSDAALAEVHAVSRGVPRVINTLCDNVLLELFFARQQRAEADFVHAIAEQLGLLTPLVRPEAAPLVEDPPALPGTVGEDAVETVPRDAPAAESAAVTSLAEDIASRVADEPVDIEVEPLAALGVSDEDAPPEPALALTPPPPPPVPMPAPAAALDSASSPTPTPTPTLMPEPEPAVAPLPALSSALPPAATPSPVTLAKPPPPKAPPSPAPVPVPSSAPKKTIDLKEIDDLLADIAKLT